jgi:ABC-type nitrate/sulfonate/bicarbonate transport system substrate-binding protein
MKRRDFLGSALAVGGALSTGMVIGPGVARAQSKGLTPVRFTCGANLGYTNLFTADGAGLFRKHGIDAQIVIFDVGFLGTEAVLAGQADTATTAAFPMINFVAKGADLVVPAIMITGDNIKIVALNTIAKPEDFAGKRVGLIHGSVAHYGFDRYIEHFKVPKDKVKIENVPAAEQIALFAKGDLDAFVWVEPVVSRGIEIMKGKARLMVPNLEVVMTNRDYLQVQRAWAAKNTAVIENILRALIEANELIKADINVGAAHAAKRLNLPADTVPDLLRKGGSRWDIYLDAVVLDDLKSITDWMRDNKRLAAEPGDLRRIMAPQYLRAVAPASVRGF